MFYIEETPTNIEIHLLCKKSKFITVKFLQSKSNNSIGTNCSSKAESTT